MFTDSICSRVVTIRLSPLPNTPSLRQPRFKCSSNQRFEAIVRFLRRKLGLGEHEGVFCYVNSVFAPGLDEGVGNLWRVSLFSLSLSAVWTAACWGIFADGGVLCSALRRERKWWLVIALRRLLGERVFGVGGESLEDCRAARQVAGIDGSVGNGRLIGSREVGCIYLSELYEC